MDNRLETTQSVAVKRNGLPNLAEVLGRSTQPPVDLFSFYIYMRDQQRSVDYLDFWLDVAQHMSLCRHYVRNLRRSVLLETPEADTSGEGKSKSSSQPLDQFNLSSGEEKSSSGNGVYTSSAEADSRLSAFLRSDRRNGYGNGNGSGNDKSSSHSQKVSSGDSQKSGVSGESEQPRPSAAGPQHDSDSPGKDSSPRELVAREDIRASAEKILYSFLLPGSEREIILPQAILNQIVEDIEEHGRDDPEVFDQAKAYVFTAMERDAFPGFLRSKALGNLVPPSLMVRLIVGLISMFGGFWAAFVLIFIDASRRTRCWLILPFTIGVYALATHQYTLDPLLALAGYSEYTFFSFTKIKEPFVKKLLTTRAVIAIMWIIGITVALVCLFVFVPGKRL